MLDSLKQDFSFFFFYTYMVSQTGHDCLSDTLQTQNAKIFERSVIKTCTEPLQVSGFLAAQFLRCHLLLS